MAVTQNSYTGNNSTTTYSFTFPYLKTSEIKASLDGTVTTAFTTPTATTVQFNTAPDSGVKIKIYRETDSDSLAATFYAGSAIKSEDLNDNFTQNLYTTQEVNSRYVNKLGGSVMEGDLTFGEDTKLIFEGATDNAHETTLTVADPTADRTITLPNITGTVVTTGDTGTVATGMIANDAINGTKIADDAVDSEHIAADSLDTEHYAPASIDATALASNSVITAKILDSNVTEDKIADLNVTRNKIAADAINGGKIADDSIDSEHYIDGSIDTAHIANDAVDATKLANTSVTAGTYSAADITVDAQGRLTAASSGTIARSEIAANAIDGTKLADNAVDSEHYTDGSIDHVHLANDIIDGDNIQDDVVNSEHIAAGALDNEHYAAGSIDSGKLSAATVVTNSEQASASVNDTSFFTTSAADARYFNISSGDTIKDGQTFPDNDTTIATTAAINDRIIDLVDDVGGFVPIANETSFPTTNPDVNNGAGTLVSIKALSSNLVSNGSGVATISNGAGSGNTVTITGLANSTTYAATFGLIVETTSTLHTYTFHRQVPKATEVTTVAGSISNVNTVAGAISNVNAVAGNATNINAVAGNNSNITSVAGNSSNINSAVSNASNINSAVSNASNINTVAGSISNVNTVGGSISNVNTVATNMSGVNDFADRYRVASSAPSSNNDEGDLYFDTTANELKVYNGSAWQGGVTASGNFASVTGNTFTGTNSHGDNVKSQYGASNDLQIYHNANNSVIADTGTGNLSLQTNDSTVNIWNSTDSAYIAQFIGSGANELYYDGSKKFETTSYGSLVTGNFTVGHSTNNEVLINAGDGAIEITRASGAAYIDFKNSTGEDYDLRLQEAGGGLNVTGNVSLPDSKQFIAGSSSDLQIYHTGSHSIIKNITGNLILQNDSNVVIEKTGGENMIVTTGDGSVDLYYDGSKKFETTSGGVDVTGALNVDKPADYWSTVSTYVNVANYGGLGTHGSYEITLTAGGYRKGSSQWQDYTVNSQSGFGAQIALNPTNGNIVFRTESGMSTGDSHGITERMRIHDTGEIQLPDNGKFTCGAGNDVQIYHDGSNSWIENTTGELILRSTTDMVRFRTNEFLIKNNTNTENYIYAVQNGAVDLYYDAVKKFETKSGGTKTTGLYHLVSNPGGTAYLEIGQGATGDNYAHIDLVGDTTYNDYGFRILRGNTGANTSSNIYHRGTGWLAFNCVDSAGMLFMTSNSTKWRIDSNGDFRNANDSGKLMLGAGNDLQIYHNGTVNVIDSNNGNLEIRHGTEKLAAFAQDGQAELYHNNSKKLETTSSGINVTGSINVNGAPLAGGNTFTATANGSISTSKAVKLDTDGKVSEIKISNVARNDAVYVGDGNLSTSGTDYQWSMSFYDSTMNRAIFVYYVDGNIKGRIGEPNSTTEPSSFSFGTEATLFTGVDQSGFDACYDTNTQRVVLFIRNGSGNGQCKVCVPTGGSTNTIAGGSTANVIGAVESVGVTYEPTSQKVIFVAEWGSNRIVKSQVGTVGDTSISLETSQFMIADNSAHRYYFYNIVPLTANKFLAIGEKSSDNYLYAFVGSISGTTVTWESPVAISTASGQWCTAGFNTTTNHITFAWRNTSNGRPYYRPATLSGTTITFGSIDTLYNIGINASAKHVRCWYEPTSDTTCILYHNASDNKGWFERHIHQSGTTAPTNIRRTTVFTVALLYVGDVTVMGSTGRSLFAFHRGNADKNVWLISDHIEATSNLTDGAHYVGYATDNYTNGQTATIATYGNNVNSLSGLTIGTEYFVQGDGTIATTKDNTNFGFMASNTPLAGTALSATKLLIRDPLAKT